ncbi:MAG: hypothetical protein KIT87_06380 [Anaerolineae bacterium]|nr:hypothetical protein [Anaerolineae bacterium]
MVTTHPLSPSDVQEQFGSNFIPTSFVTQDGAAFWLQRAGQKRQLAIAAPPDAAVFSRFHGQSQAFRDGYRLMLCPTSHANARALRATLPSLTPQPFGLATSAGFGDRLGLATPGHIRALERVLAEAPGKTIAPIFAQQSIREMNRTRRTPDDVLSDATWGTFQAGWRGPVGADADHLKTPDDIDICAAAGYSFYTFDPGAYVDSEVDEAPAEAVQRKVEGLAWDRLESSAKDLERAYVGQRFRFEHLDLQPDKLAVYRAAAKYGGAIAHVAAMYRHLVSKGVPCEVEVSVDETETPTTHFEHIYIASELKRLGVKWVSLAPRYVGRFEKGVDYIGDLGELQRDLDGHAAIARALGPYKLSLHSGSDKFSVYPLIVQAAYGQVHLKTAGTSYLEALRVLSHVDTALFRAILDFDRGRYEEDKASYHVSADVSKVPPAASLSDRQLPALLEDFDAREVLHVTFGSTLAQFGEQLMAALYANEEAYDETLERHFYRHLKPFA